MTKVLLAVFGAGALGGLVNALLSGAGFVLPRLADVAGSKVLSPGFLGNILIGGVAAFLSYCLYGPFASFAVIQGSPAAGGAAPLPVQLTLAALAGAILVGFSGGRWMTAEADKQLNHGTAVATSQVAERLAARPTASLNIPHAVQAPKPVQPGLERVSRSLATGTPRAAYEEARKLLDSLPPE